MHRANTPPKLARNFQLNFKYVMRATLDSYGEGKREHESLVVSPEFSGCSFETYPSTFAISLHKIDMRCGCCVGGSFLVHIPITIGAYSHSLLGIIHLNGSP